MKITALMAGVAAAALMVSGAQAADLILPTEPAPVYESSSFDFEGFYLGVQGGGVFYNGFDDDDDLLDDDDINGSGAGLVGIVAGANFAVSDAFLLGAEVQSNLYFGDNFEGDGVDDEDDNAFGAWDIAVIGKAGAVVTDGVFVYGLAGVGFANGEDEDNNTYWTAGVGAEFAVSDAFSLRAEAAYVRNFDANDDELDLEADGFDEAAGKFTVGALWHFN